eukprot:12967433-Heterocapsa_arctica.AAC.1
MSCKIGAQENRLGYIAYKDMGNAKYKEVLDKYAPSQKLGQGKAGDLMECMLGMGFLYQTGKCDKLEGIMEL